MIGVGVCDLRLTSLFTLSFGSSLRAGGGILWTAGEFLDGAESGLDGTDSGLDMGFAGTFTMTFLIVGGGGLPPRAASPKKFMFGVVAVGDGDLLMCS